MKINQISDFKLGCSIQGFYLCKEKHLQHTRGGELYLDIVFSDATGTIRGKLWDLVDHFQDRFQSGDPVAVKGQVTEFDNHLQLTVSQINYATERQYQKYGFSHDLLFKTVEEPLDNLWDSLMEVIENLHEPYKKITQYIFREHEHKIRIIPGSIHYDNPIRGGFLKHLVTTSKMSIDILPYYSSLNKDLVLCGILIHRIGQVECIDDDLQSSYTDAGRLVGHVALGINILRETALSFKNISEDILLKLEHIIISQNSFGDVSAPRASRFPEAIFIHYIDTLDDRINIMLDAIANDSNSEWTDQSNYFSSELYKK